MVQDISGCASVILYLDDFLCIGAGQNRVCSLLLHMMERVLAEFGVPLALEKTEGPTMVLSFFSW